ncbi:MAG: hypothetical protein IKO19_08775 [Candidatus Riflebacteria bacterium]|nr:hypothetical protein [Candidatus Riflebacteria bacterium]
MSVPLLNTYCRRCHAAIMSNAHTCPLCGLSRPNAANISSFEKSFISSPPNIPERFESTVSKVKAVPPLLFQLPSLYFSYIDTPKDGLIHRTALTAGVISVFIYTLTTIKNIIFLKHLLWMIMIIAFLYIIYDSIHFMKSVYSNYVLERLQIQGGSSPYSVHFKVETVLMNTLKSLQSLLYAFYEKPWEEMKNDPELKQSGNSFVLAVQAVTAKIKKFSQVSLETITLLWRNNVYAITSLPDVSYEDKIKHLKLKITEAKAVILRYCWLRQIEMAHEFLEDHLNGKSGRSTPDDAKYVIEGMQLGLYGPLTEPFHGNLETVPYELPFIMRYYWHQQLSPSSFPEEEITAQYPETAELFESIGQVRNLIQKLEEQKILSMAENAVTDDYKTEAQITSEARQIKKFQLYSDYLDIPKFQPSDAELLKQVDRLNAELRVQ